VGGSEADDLPRPLLTKEGRSADKPGSPPFEGGVREGSKSFLRTCPPLRDERKNLT